MVEKRVSLNRTIYKKIVIDVQVFLKNIVVNDNRHFSIGLMFLVVLFLGRGKINCKVVI